jgi:hypothetical protein
MRRRSTFALAAVLGCAGPTDPPVGPLVGRWISATEALRPAGSHQYSLEFGAGGRFTAEVRSYGLYPGQAPADLSAYSRMVGGYRTAGGRLTFAPDTLVEWDRFYGAQTAPTVRTPYPYGGPYDDARYAVTGGVLTLRYLSYPADAPVETARQFRRAD